MRHELQYRISQARAAYHEAKRKIYKNRAIRIARKSTLLEATVLSRLLQGAGAWPRLAKGETKIFEAAIWGFYRGMLCIPRTAHQSVTAMTCCALVRLPTPATLLRKARLLYLRQIVASGPPQLWAVVRADTAYTSLLRQDLQWLHLWSHTTAPLPDPNRDWEAWRRFMLDRPGPYKGLVKRVCQLDSRRTSFLAALDGLYRGLRLLSGVPDILPAPAAGTYEHMCLPCKRAFSSKVAWSGHAARLHGYRSTAYLLGEGCLCQGCGKSFSSPGRLRRHLTSVPACTVLWGSFEPTEGCRRYKTAHPQAPPQVEAGLRVHAGLDFEDTHHLPLWQELEQLFNCAEEEVWSVIIDHIAPLPLLRATVAKWCDAHSGCAWHAEIAENMLLLLDPNVSAEHFPSDAPPLTNSVYDTPVWERLQPLCLNLTGPVQSFSLGPPPQVTLNLDCPTSVPLQQATNLLLWTEDACRVLIACASAAAVRPVRLTCPGIWNSLPVARAWFEALGFRCDDEGFRTPC